MIFAVQDEGLSVCGRRIEVVMQKAQKNLAHTQRPITRQGLAVWGGKPMI